MDKVQILQSIVEHNKKFNKKWENNNLQLNKQICKDLNILTNKITANHINKSSQWSDEKSFRETNKNIIQIWLS